MTGRGAFERTIARDTEIESEIRKSRFICTLRRVTSEADARAAIDAVRTRYWNASHHCTAWRIGPGGRLQRSNDDGEPAGTAGTPMLEVLSRRELTDTLAIVTRYYGGTNLGTGGLIRAYGGTVSAAVARSGIVERRPVHLLTAGIAHGDSGRIEHALRAAGFDLADVSYNADDVQMTVHLDPDTVAHYRAWLAELTSGRADAIESGRQLAEVTVEPGTDAGNEGSPI
jgi:uncharacterized YigZ family protein